MTKKLEIYKCDICGNIVEVLHTGQGALVCCGEEMKLQDPQTDEMSNEKHVPYVEETDTGVKVKVGYNQNHPMIEEHYIEWISINVGGDVMRKFLSPGDDPEVEFDVDITDIDYALEYCNVHGLWINEME